MGPKTFPIFCVPKRWKKKSSERITTTIGTEGMLGIIIFKPSTADATDIGGVIIQSAKSVVAPKIVGITSRFTPYRRTTA